MSSPTSKPKPSPSRVGLPIQQLLIGLSLMSFSILCIHGICQTTWRSSPPPSSSLCIPLPSASTSPSFTPDSASTPTPTSTSTRSNTVYTRTISPPLDLLQASNAFLASQISVLQSALTQIQQATPTQQCSPSLPKHPPLTNNEIVSLLIIAPSFLFLIGLFVFLEACNKISMAYMQHRLLAVFGCANAGMAWIVLFGGGDVVWWQGLVRVLWAVVGALGGSLLVGGEEGEENVVVDVVVDGGKKQD